MRSILQLVPSYEEFRDPMVGGGSLFFALKRLHPEKKYWINDLNKELYYFWKYCKENPRSLVSQIRRLRRSFRNGKTLYKHLMLRGRSLTRLQRAARFFILNRITFSGLVETGGYSKEAFNKRFTESSIRNIYNTSRLLKGVKITNLDYSKVLKRKNSNVFVFLDPPYLSSKASKLYGTKGRLHTNFDHELLFKNVGKCKHKCLITYDDCAGINELYKVIGKIGWKRKRWRLRYGTNVGRERAKVGRELFILNY